MQLPPPIANSLVEQSHDGLRLHVRPVFHPIPVLVDRWIVAAVAMTFPVGVAYLAVLTLIWATFEALFGSGAEGAGVAAAAVASLPVAIPFLVPILVPLAIGTRRIALSQFSGGLRVEVDTHRLQIREDGGRTLVDLPLGEILAVVGAGDALQIVTESARHTVVVPDRSREAIEELGHVIDQARRQHGPGAALRVGSASEVPEALQALRVAQ